VYVTCCCQRKHAVVCSWSTSASNSDICLKDAVTVWCRTYCLLLGLL
jgi:hypothetical protein